MDAEQLANLIIRHDLAARNLDAGEADKIVRLLNDTLAEMKERLLGRYAVAQAKGIDRGPATTKRLEDMIAGFEAINAEVYSKIGERIEGQLIDRACHEFRFTADAVKKAGGVVTGATIPDTNYLRTLVRNVPIQITPETATLLQPYLKDMEANNLARLGRILTSGLNSGRTPVDIAREIETQGFATSRNSAQGLVLTANSSVANAARLETFRNMKSVKFLEWSSILDSRTTPGCQDLSGKIFPIDGPHPACPRHIRCRSLYIPRKNDTDPPLHKPYKQWLKEQSADVQDEVLGKGRGEEFRKGGNPDDLYRPDGTYKTLEQLKRGDARMTAAAPVSAPAKVDTDKIDATEKAYVLKQGRATGNEHLVAYDTRTGERIERKEGGPSHVNFSDPLVTALRDPRNSIVLHHNHPRSTSLSLPDMLVVTRQPGAKAIWAHGHNGSSFYAEPGEFELKEKTVRAIGDRIHEALQKLITLGVLKIDDAILIDNHLIWLAVQGVGQIVYRAKLVAESAAAYERNKTLFERVLESLK